ncbi:hypothetical protein NA57DRAFT_48248, partial [Rhizodiscina lignyota]
PEGYPMLAAFLDSDENFMIYRRFGYIHARLLLEKQNELQELENILGDMDNEDDSERPGCLNRAELGSETPSERQALFAKLEARFKEYAKLLLFAKDLTSLPRPSASSYRSFRNFFWNTRPLCQRDEPWIEWKEDMITLRTGRERAWLDDGVENLLRILNCHPVRYVFRSRETKRKTEGRTKANELYFSRNRVENLVLLIITMSILGLLVAPVYILYRVTNDNGLDTNGATIAVGTLLLFTLAFSTLLSFFTRARRHEIFGAAAAYCAVLVVFFGNMPVISQRANT